MNKILLHICR